ncbi:MAG: SDR family oxidoreductase [Parachlamydia sp.]|jgi:NAD(P)-dependent dehydrogenase (short-subunit alcohol dehydrogenase family)|nr:SDR family oxidoreductase [Parachlamydia sp.]
MWTLVTGGAKRLGAHLCETLISMQQPVVIHYNTSQKEAFDLSEKLKGEGGVVATIQGDFSSVESTLEFAARYNAEFGRTKALINNVGNFIIKGALATEVEEWVSLFQTNLHAPFILIKALTPSLIAEKGVIVNIGVSGLERGPHTFSAAYTLTKEALLGLTRSFSKELAPKGVRVNMISPGYLDFSVYLPKELPMGRPAYGHEVGHALGFLLDPQSSYITGQNIEIAGGV